MEHHPFIVGPDDPILITGAWPGVRLRMSCNSTGLTPRGSVPAYGSMAEYSNERPRNPEPIGRIGNPALRGLPVPSRDVLPRYGAPESVARIRQVDPALDTGEYSLDSWPIALDDVLS